MRDTKKEAEEEADSMQGALRGTPSRNAGIMPWAKGRRSTAKPPRRPRNKFFEEKNIFLTL